MGRNDMAEDVKSNWLTAKEFREAVAPKCDRCDKPAMWNARARTTKLCDDCYRKLEWSRA